MATATKSQTKANGDKPQAQSSVTRYLVQHKQRLNVLRDATDEVSVEVEAWVDLGTYEGKGGRRSAIKLAMARHNLEEGDFRGLTMTSAEEEHPRVDKTTRW